MKVIHTAIIILKPSIQNQIIHPMTDGIILVVAIDAKNLGGGVKSEE
jgi:hypothetical protein